jgi:hypothetical protein
MSELQGGAKKSPKRSPKKPRSPKLNPLTRKECQCLTKNNTKCKRLATKMVNGKYYCFQHKNCKNGNRRSPSSQIFVKPSAEDFSAYFVKISIRPNFKSFNDFDYSGEEELNYEYERSQREENTREDFTGYYDEDKNPIFSQYIEIYWDDLDSSEVEKLITEKLQPLGIKSIQLLKRYYDFQDSRGHKHLFTHNATSFMYKVMFKKRVDETTLRKTLQLLSDKYHRFFPYLDFLRTSIN